MTHPGQPENIMTQVSHPFQLLEVTPKKEKFSLQYSIMMTDGFYTNPSFAGKEIR
jgi:hypothetical protein